MLSEANNSVHFVSLGCSKNLVDAEVMLGHLNLKGFRIEQDPAKARIIIVNTCSFVGPAKEESISTILDMADYKKVENGQCEVLVVSGCMTQRYSKELEVEFPEVDLFIGTGEYPKIAKLIQELDAGKLPQKSFVDVPFFIHTELDPRINTAPPYMAWLKISEGCDRNCTFCIIPTLRGRLRSRTVESLIIEAKRLVSQGVKELNLISQDLSSYGKDLTGPNKLIDLLKGLENIEGVHWIRLFYFYPDDLTDDVMDLMANSKKICAYLDMPVQHFSTRMLKLMNRRISGEVILEKIKRLREKIPSIVIRTSLIVGFPGETEEDFEQLLAGIEAAQFDHLGVFKYSDEEGTPAFHLKPKIDEETIDERHQAVYQLQKDLSHDLLNEKYVGKTLEVLVEGPHEETELLWQGRFFGQAPDIDGKVLINDLAGQDIKAGDIVTVNITEAYEYDLVGGIVGK